MNASTQEPSAAVASGPNPFWVSTLKNFLIPGRLLGGFNPQQLQAVQQIADLMQRRERAQAETLLADLERSFTRVEDRDADSPAQIVVQILHGLIEASTQRLAATEARFAKLAARYRQNADLQFNWAMGLLAINDLPRAAEVLERLAAAHPTMDPLAVPLAIVAALLGKHELAEHWSRRARAAGQNTGNDIMGLVLMQATLFLERPEIEGGCRFDAGQDCADTSRIDALLAAFPQVQGDPWGHGLDRPTLFVAADPVYFKQHVLPLLWSVLESGSPWVVHVHVYNPTPELLVETERLRARLRPFPLRFTFEQFDPNVLGPLPLYASTVRFLRLYQLLMASTTPVICLDADMIVRRDLSTLPGLNDPAVSVGLTEVPHEPIWNHFAAGVTYFKPTEFGKRFLRRVATFIAHNLQLRTGRWLLDQIALFEAVRALDPRDGAVARICSDQVCDLKYGEDSYIWAITLDKSSPRYVEYREQLEERYASCVTYLDYRVETVQSTHGPMMILPGDRYIGPSIKHLGVWCKNEIDVLKQLIPWRGVVVDGGANMGSHTIPFGQFVGPGGRVLAFEPQRLIYYVLAGNVALNGMTQIECYNLGLSDRASELGIGAPIEAQNFGCVRLSEGKSNPYVETITTRTLDSFQLDQCDVIKLDIEGMELEAIRGARETIDRFHPILYLENHEGPKCQPLIDLVISHGYRAWWHGVETHNPNLLCIHRSRPVRVEGLNEALASNAGAVSEGGDRTWQR